MGEFETPLLLFLFPAILPLLMIGDQWQHCCLVTALRLDALTFNVLPAQTFVTTLSATCSTGSVSSVALHADFAVKHSSFSFRESCHDMATHFVYLTTTRSKRYLNAIIQTLGAYRLPCASSVCGDTSRCQCGSFDWFRRSNSHRFRYSMVPTTSARTNYRTMW